MMFDDEEAPDSVEGVSEPAAARSRNAVVAHSQHGTEVYPPPVFHPPVYRGVLASWPEDWRERWGRRANDLEEAGLPWRDAEAQAFAEVWNQFRREPRSGGLAPVDADPERN
jgi:hypothetical protein